MMTSTPRSIGTWFRWAGVFLAFSATLPGARPAPPIPPLASGLAEFAGRASHNHWNLFGSEKRAELESLNRELREAQQQIQRAADDAARETAALRGQSAATRLRELAESCPRRLRVDVASPRVRLDPPGPVILPGDTGALLLDIQAPGEGLQYTTSTGDLSQPRGETSLITIDSASTGKTYALVGLEHVPFGRTTLTLEVRRPGQGSVRLPLEVEVPPPGRLKLTVLSDDTGKPTPAMVRLMWRTDGLQRQPANGIEFATQFDRQGTASGARAANLPGPLSAHFWCVPGPFDMTLAPGIWQIGVRRGVEHEAVFEDVTIRSGETIERTVRPKRWVDMRQKGWWSGDDHVHGRILSDDDARHLMAWIQAEDIHLANVVKMGDIYRTYFEQRGFGPNYRVVEGEHALVPGQECPRTHDQIGHTLAMNITSMVRQTDRYFLYDEVFDAVHAQGGLTGYAHVNSGMFNVHRDMSLNVPRQKVDFVEILQFNQLGTDLYYDFLNLGCKLTASAGSDVPWGGTVGEVRAYAYLEGKPFSADLWFDAFRRGRTFTTSGPMIEFQVDDAWPGDEVRVSGPRELKVRARAWGDPARMTPIHLEVVRQGDVLRTADSSSTNPAEATLEFTVSAGDGFWIAARARGGDGTSAHTSPVYVIREKLRFWKFEVVAELIAKRMASLQEIEQMVTQARQLDADGKLETDRYWKQFALQGNALMDRVTRMRGVYEELQRTAVEERKVREVAAP